MADMNKTAATSAGVQNTTSKAASTSNSSVKKELSFDDKVVEKIVGMASDEVPGILTMTGGILGGLNNRLHVTNQTTAGIDAEVGKKQVAVDLNAVVEYGKYVPDLFDAVIAKISQAVKDMTGLDVIEVNMKVQDVLSADEFQKTVQQQKQKNMQMNNNQTAPAPQTITSNGQTYTRVQ